ncbi:MAG: LysR family transcriptional regulator [Alcanivorax sp.]|nr:LysR family transcriptional regulator [Alcanivorax sp.]
MDRFEQYRVFAQVAEMGSFTKAAKLLKIPRASVSAAVQQLEAQVGTRLLHRTTRSVQVTPDGEQLLKHIYPLLIEVESIENLFQSPRQQVSGRLIIEAPSRIARRIIAPELPGLLRKHPALQVVMSSADRAINLVEEGVDCAVRVGELHDGSLVAKPLGSIALANCASPEYLHKYGEPGDPDALAEGHWVVGYAASRSGKEEPWEYCLPNGDTQQLTLPAWVTVNNAENYIACCIAGLGLIQVPRFDIQHLLDSGKLVEVMSSHRAPAMPVSLVYPHRRQNSRRLRVFMAWFSETIRPHLEASA